MTQNTLTLRSFEIPKFSVGFEELFNELSRTASTQTNTNYPPYNILKYNENKFAIELAVAGFKEGDISIVVNRNMLTILSKESVYEPESTEETETVEYLHHGISSRSFNRTFTLGNYVEVSSATVKNGILKIVLERIIPEDHKPKMIDISYSK